MVTVLRTAVDETTRPLLQLTESPYAAGLPRSGQRSSPRRSAIGSTTVRLLRRLPAAHPTLIDLNPVLLTVAAASLPPHVTITQADLCHPQWTDALPHRSYHAVLATTALHCLPPSRLSELYREIREVLAPGGVFCNADLMPDDNVPLLTARFAASRRDVQPDASDTWEKWWQRAAADPSFGPLAAERELTFHRPSADYYPPMSWHLNTLRATGYRDRMATRRGGRHRGGKVNSTAADRPPGP